MIDRIRGYLTERERRTCDREVAFAHGTALVTDSLPRVWVLNTLRVEAAHAEAADVAEDADRLQRGMDHRRAVVRDEALGSSLVPGFEELGWKAERVGVMVHARKSDGVGAGPRAREAAPVAAAPLAAELRRDWGCDESAADELAALDERLDMSLGGRAFAAPAEGPFRSSCRLYSLDGVAEIDGVGTAPTDRGRGLAYAVTRAAAEAAVAAGAELIFLLADDDDHVRRLYQRLGFDPLTSFYEFLRPPPGFGRP